MANVFEGVPDARQAANEAHNVSRFRTTYRALNEHEKEMHDEIKASAVLLESYIDSFAIENPKGARYAALAMTNLELAIMLAIKALTA